VSREPVQATDRRAPKILDLFCGAGGAAMGYYRAGFRVVGVDIKPQPHYPFTFWQADATQFLDWVEPEEYAAIHASPPCQGYTSMNNRYASKSPLLIRDVRAALKRIATPYVIENVSGARAHMDHPVQLCGRSLGLGVARHRLFECSFPCMAIQCACRGDELPVYGKLDGRRLWTRKDGSELRAAKTLEEAQAAMGIDWMTWDELREAIPPAMTEHIGGFLIREVERRSRLVA
jgi:DNA (cytosine-5)-methyltransferase 1